ncbi:hypothetical protein CQ046_07100 [Chryseobacterium sp. MYb7]|jgi:hypothetical protein|uniref:hypothetical protein n=1 Tax=Chryseobacterium sp. MYb7 TaxID=1827290 RepID=UPI000D00438F|nr:hypothetical protein [Chryseobacterium sp. MYb7]PRB04474.1 hypothetical protein CQ046_07100 [Chryseobacterium sp. MYb7]
MKKTFLFLLATLLFISCEKDCYNAPLPIVFKFVDSNNENLIANGTLTSYSIQDENNVSVQLSKTSDNMIILENVGAYNGTKKYHFSSTIKPFDFSIQSSEFKGACDGYQINKITFTGIGIDVTDEKGYYKIVLQ